MVQISREHVHFTFSGAHKPAAFMESGDTACFETYDCFYNQLVPKEATLKSADLSKCNAATGPLYINGARPGDMLKVEIQNIELGPVGVCYTNSGCAWDDGHIKEEVFRRFTVKDGSIQFNDSVNIPISPMIGVIGTAPNGGEISTMTPLHHGGNMDCTKIQAGSTLFLPVSVPGGLLSMGDLHAVMGDGEVCGCGLEIEGHITVRVSVVHENALPWPALISGGQFMVIASADTVDDAWKLATARMSELLTSRAGLTCEDAAMLLSLCGDLAICQTVNPTKTVRMAVPMGVFGEKM